MDMSTTETPIPITPTRALPKSNAIEIANVERTQHFLSERIQLLQHHRNQLQKYLNLIQTLDDDDDDDDIDDETTK